MTRHPEPRHSPASADTTNVVRPGAFLTLHYRISLADSGEDVVSTFGGRPATLQMGFGQLAEPLELRLLGLPEGDTHVFELAPAQAYGDRNPELVRKLARDAFDRLAPADEARGAGDTVDFPTPDGGRFAGVLKQLTEDYALLDFNHPLAGHAIRFEVRILGIL